MVSSQLALYGRKDKSFCISSSVNQPLFVSTTCRRDGVTPPPCAEQQTLRPLACRSPALMLPHAGAYEMA
eukprot:434433-Hanusia_phi.AAC.2